MDAFLIVSAIFLSVILLFKYAVPIGRPKISIGERMSDDALRQRFESLGKECRVTRRGFGMYFGNFNVRKKLSLIESKVKNDKRLREWERVLYENKDLLLSAYVKSLGSVRMSYAMGHVSGDFPRLFVLCSEIVKCCNGDLTEQRTELALESFQKYAPLTDIEKKYFSGMLVFCLCGFVCAFADIAEKYGAMHEKGVADGRADKADLDSIKNDFYVDGLLEGSNRASNTIAVLESNMINIESASNARRTFESGAYAICGAAVRSAYMLLPHIYGDLDRSVNNARKRIVTLLNVALIASIAATVVLVCVFASEAYAATVAVAAVILYGCLRLPVLLYSPENVFVLSDRLKKRSVSDKTEIMPVLRKSDSEFAYFGDLSEFSVNTLFCGKLKVDCDSNGNIEITDGCADGLHISFTVNGKTYELSEFYGMHARNRSIYRLLTDFADMSVEIVTPVDYRCCCVKITIANRKNEVVAATALMNLVTERIGEVCVDSCAAVIGMDCVTGVLAGSNARYGVRNEFFAGVRSRALSCEADFELPPFYKASKIFCIVCGSSLDELRRVYDHVKSDGYFEFACDGAYAYGGARPLYSERAEYYWHTENKDFPAAEYVTPSLPDVDSFKIGRADFTESGELYPYSCDTVNTLRGGFLSAEFYKNVIGKIYETVSGRLLPCGGHIGILLGENGVIWSPFSGVVDFGEHRTKFGFGFAMYECAYNGCVCSVKCCVDRSSDRSLLLNITVLNTVSESREIDVLLSARAARDSAVVAGTDKIAVISEDSPFTVFCSREISECAAHEDSWYIKGRAAKTRDLSSKGSVPAAVASIRLAVAQDAAASVDFRISFDESEVKNSVSDNVGFIENIDKIKLFTSDKTLNIAYKRALYTAYMGGLLSDCDDCAVLCCCKYADPSTVRDALVRLLSKQRINGDFVGYNGIAVCYAVADYVSFCGDSGFMSVRVPFLPYYSNGKKNIAFGTVKEHCALFLDKAYDANGYGGVAANVVFYKLKSKTYAFFAAIMQKDAPRADYYTEKAKEAAIAHKQQAALSGSDEAYRFKTEYDALICSLALYSCGRYKDAYEIIRVMADRLLSGRFLNVCGENSRECSLFFLAVTEMLLGVRINDKRVKIYPKTTENNPHIEFEITNGKKNTRVVIDDSKRNGDWRIKVDRVCYSGDSIIVDDKTDRIILYRDGKQ